MGFNIEICAYKNKYKLIFLSAEKEADNVIKEFLKNSDEERQNQTKLLEQEKQEEMQLLKSCYSEQFTLRMKDTLCELRT
jgi:uncharacterized protein YbgA (DUF1722 family)